MCNQVENCVFCQLAKDKAFLFETLFFFVVWDIDPIQTGHLLIITKAHRMNLLELTDEETEDLMTLQKRMIQALAAVDETIGFSIAANNGFLMDEGTHYHCHLIPRYEGDGFWDGIHPQPQPFPKEAFLKQI